MLLQLRGEKGVPACRDALQAGTHAAEATEEAPSASPPARLAGDKAVSCVKFQTAQKEERYQQLEPAGALQPKGSSLSLAFLLYCLQRQGYRLSVYTTASMKAPHKEAQEAAQSFVAVISPVRQPTAPNGTCKVDGKALLKQRLPVPDRPPQQTAIAPGAHEDTTWRFSSDSSSSEDMEEEEEQEGCCTHMRRDGACNGKKAYELLIMQQPNLSVPFIAAVAAAVEVNGGVFSGSGGDFLLRPRSVAPLCLHLVCFDMDSTLIEEEVIDELAAERGVAAQVAAITRQAMGGSVAFAKSLRQRLSLLKGLDRFDSSSLGSETDPLLNSRKLVGEPRDPLITPEVKAQTLIELSTKLQDAQGKQLQAQLDKALQEGAGGHDEPNLQSLRALAAALEAATSAAAKAAAAGANAAAVGDGSNDILMLQAAATGIAFCAKEKVQAAVPLHLNRRDLCLLAFFLGISYPVWLLADAVPLNKTDNS
ncbi:uncharacterized protein LOC34621784 [Cyclospora cayetanensis]|uniref:phosphoserine phosphatase n=1 Tax=Cyclospora cayetanensis TaxID=88456 RepID=A0A6P6RQY3_9EIME|nr:uncharacterized protein LOC34621784 [Cyclospora cayetanensis]